MWCNLSRINNRVTARPVLVPPVLPFPPPRRIRLLKYGVEIFDIVNTMRPHTHGICT